MIKGRSDMNLRVVAGGSGEEKSPVEFRSPETSKLSATAIENLDAYYTHLIRFPDGFQIARVAIGK